MLTEASNTHGTAVVSVSTSRALAAHVGARGHESCGREGNLRRLLRSEHSKKKVYSHARATNGLDSNHEYSIAALKRPTRSHLWLRYDNHTKSVGTVICRILRREGCGRKGWHTEGPRAFARFNRTTSVRHPLLSLEFTPTAQATEANFRINELQTTTHGIQVCTAHLLTHTFTKTIRSVQPTAQRV